MREQDYDNTLGPTAREVPPYGSALGASVPVATQVPAMVTITERTALLVADVREYNTRLADLLDRLGLPENDSPAGTPTNAAQTYGVLGVATSNLDELADAVRRSARLIRCLHDLI